MIKSNFMVDVLLWVILVILIKTIPVIKEIRRDIHRLLPPLTENISQQNDQ